MVDGCRKETQQYEQSLQSYNLFKYLGSTTSVLGRFSYFLNPVTYSVIHIPTHPSKELCSKMALGEVGLSLP